MMRLQFVRATSLKRKVGHVKHLSMALALCVCAYHITHPLSADNCISCCIDTAFTLPTLKIQALPTIDCLHFLQEKTKLKKCKCYLKECCDFHVWDLQFRNRFVYPTWKKEANTFCRAI